MLGAYTNTNRHTHRVAVQVFSIIAHERSLLEGMHPQTPAANLQAPARFDTAKRSAAEGSGFRHAGSHEASAVACVRARSPCQRQGCGYLSVIAGRGLLLRWLDWPLGQDLRDKQSHVDGKGMRGGQRHVSQTAMFQLFQSGFLTGAMPSLCVVEW